ncbi:hypothetical protein H5V45_04830 [Nocardioides sp. KIGAM211]|uniref:Uncharacterized protein n=1 Tax=Nocardioides luti TaxID=2761101 RepID=A0A7X0RE89_9ACTN|nr:hypothetical protein [Nocardioides luti]MBB6626642.1 hypothetical protein [Nocardioides luti]
MDDSWPAFFAGLAVLAVAALAAWFWRPTRVRLQRWWIRGTAEADEAAADAENEQMHTLREQVPERARKVGKPMPVSSSGNRVTYADGHTTTYIADFQQYRRAMESGRVDIMRTVNKVPPTPLSRRDRAWLEKWLADNPEP